MFAKFIRSSALVQCCLALVATGTAISGLTGCSATRTFRQAIARNKAEDVSPTRKERQTELAREFDKKRDDTQFDAAASSWERGDPDSCEVALKQLLERNPKYRRAHLLLADLYLFNNQSDLAINELTQAVTLDEKDPAARHALAQALDGAGLRQEALEHYQAATQLQPTNELYALSFKSALGVVSPSVAPNSQEIEALATTSNPAAEPGKFSKQIGVTIDNTRTTMSPMVAKMSALARNNSSPTARAAKANASIANAATAVASIADDEQIAISDIAAAAGPAATHFGPPQLAMANAGGAIPTKKILPPQEESNPAENNGVDPAWRLAGTVRDPKEKPEFQRPLADLDAWIRPVHFEAKNAAEDSDAQETAAGPQAPRHPDTLPPASAPSRVALPPVAGPVTVAVPQTISAEQAKPSPSIKPAGPVVQAAAPRSHVPSDSKDPTNSLGNAVESLAAGDSTAAIDAATRGLSRTPDEAGALYRVLGAAHYRKGEYEAAQAALSQALSLDKTDALAYFLMGSTLEKLNEPAAASSYFSQAARLDARYAR